MPEYAKIPLNVLKGSKKSLRQLAGLSAFFDSRIVYRTSFVRVVAVFAKVFAEVYYLLLLYWIR